MDKNRLEAFSDGVLAIIITIMVLELKVPQGQDIAALQPLWPVALSYVLSFVYTGIYWNNHHHMFKVAHQVNGAVLWSNLHWLFWLSLLPFSSGWMGENHFAQWPTLLYGLNLLFCAVAYFILQHCLLAHHGRESLLARALGRDLKGKSSLLLYVVGIVSACLGHESVAMLFYVVVALIWLVPDRRMERVLKAPSAGD
jgi:uncharacterized membrane protein